MPLPKVVDFSVRLVDKKPNYIANRYLRLKVLGTGTYGSVYLVNDVRQPLVVQRAAKEIRLPQEEEEQWVNAVKEARILSSLYHPHIVQLCDAFLENGSFYIIMDYCEGGTLEDYIHNAAIRHQYLSQEHVLCWFVQLADGLSYIHSKSVHLVLRYTVVTVVIMIMFRKIIHRDLKSRNIFLVSNHAENWSDLKIGDFGISRVLFTTTEKATTMIGTPFYLSPELLQQLPYDKKSDSWALGCLLYEMCALVYPFTTNESFADLMKLIVNTEPDYSKFPEHLQNIQPLCCRLLKKMPSARLCTEEVLHHDLVSQHVNSHQNRHEYCRNVSQFQPYATSTNYLDDDPEFEIEFDQNFTTVEKVNTASSCDFDSSTLSETLTAGQNELFYK